MPDVWQCPMPSNLETDDDSPPWPFAQWVIDIVGPLPQGKGQVKFLLVAINYFKKWVEAEVLATIIKARI